MALRHPEVVCTVMKGTLNESSTFCREICGSRGLSHIVGLVRWRWRRHDHIIVGCFPHRCRFICHECL